MKNIVKLLVAASLAISLTSCLKDDEHFVDFAGAGYVAEIPYAANRSILRSTDSLVRTSATAYVFPIDVNIASPNPPTTSIPITVALDQAALTAYNTANKTTFQLLPATAFQLTNPSVTVAAGSRIATVNVNIIPSQVPTTGTYVVPVTITSVPANVTISANYRTQLLRVLLKK